jgi:Dual specificity phosphatase, catalytic domain
MNSQRPFERSYWAVPGQLLAGCYPGDLNSEAMSAKLEGLVRVGVTLVVNLMESMEVDHAGHPFVDYRLPLEKAAKKAGEQLRCVRFPIRDMSIPTTEQMREILDAIHAEIQAEGVVYVHCWGGKGRTATVVGCFLLETGLEDRQTVLEKIRSLTAHASKFFWPTPQTQEQCGFVTNWSFEAR